ncbi:hypothetical protein BH10BDE1_BH10BDE1_25090 [soil metagenome]
MVLFNFVAIALIAFLGIAHSALGEVLIFRHLRKNGQWIDLGISGLKIRQIRALWSTWHLITLFGWSLGGVLLVNTAPMISTDAEIKRIVVDVLATTFSVSTVFWLIGTKGKHPAWIVFLAISILLWFGH